MLCLSLTWPTFSTVYRSVACRTNCSARRGCTNRCVCVCVHIMSYPGLDELTLSDYDPEEIQSHTSDVDNGMQIDISAAREHYLDVG